MYYRSSVEQGVWAKEKLRGDLAEANARNALLAKEVDERHASMEKTNNAKLLYVDVHNVFVASIFALSGILL